MLKTYYSISTMKKQSKSKLNARAIGAPEHIRLLASPVRQELVDTLASLGGQATVAALSEHLGRHADGLYYHLQLLVEAGLIHEFSGDTGERTFGLAGTGQAPLRLSYELESDGAADSLRAYVKGLLQVAEHDFSNALVLPDVAMNGKHRQLWAARNKGWVNKSDLEEVNALLERLCELMSQPREETANHLMSFAFVLAPTPTRGKRRQSKQK